MNIGLHHLEIFHKVITLSDYFQAEGPVCGTGSESTAYRQFNSPSLFLQTPTGKQRVTQLMVVIGVGTTDEQYYPQAGALYKQLQSMKSSVQLFTAVGGHSWTVWTKQFGEVLPLLEPPSSRTP